MYFRICLQSNLHMRPSLVSKWPPPISNHLSKIPKSSQSNLYNQSNSRKRSPLMTWLPQVRKCDRSGEKFSLRAGKIGEFHFELGKILLKSLKEVREKWNFKSTYILFFSLYFYCFLTFKILVYILQTWIMLYCWCWESVFFARYVAFTETFFYFSFRSF